MIRSMYPASRPNESPTGLAPPPAVSSTAPAATDEQRPLVRSYLAYCHVAVYNVRVCVCICVHMCVMA